MANFSGNGKWFNNQGMALSYNKDTAKSYINDEVAKSFRKSDRNLWYILPSGEEIGCWEKTYDEFFEIYARASGYVPENEAIAMEWTTPPPLPQKIELPPEEDDGYYGYGDESRYI